MENMTLDNIAKACNGTYIGPENMKESVVTGVVIDSREVSEGNLFIPIKGERVDGHKFIPNVFERKYRYTYTEPLNVAPAHSNAVWMNESVHDVYG